MSYEILSLHFRKVKDKSVKEVGDIIGGKVKLNVDKGHFKNACALRLSYALNKAGYMIRKSDGGADGASSGADKNWYLYRVADVETFVRKIAKETMEKNTLSDFNRKKGVIVLGACGWNDATGHIDLFDGIRVEGQDYSVCRTKVLYVL